VERLPEVQIVYPGSILVASGGKDASGMFNPAAVWQAIYQVDAPWSAIKAYYREKLVALGYVEGLGVGNPTNHYMLGARTIDLFPDPGPTGTETPPNKFEFQIQQQ